MHIPVNFKCQKLLTSIVVTFFKILGGVLLLVVARFAPDTGVWAHDSQEASS